MNTRLVLTVVAVLNLITGVGMMFLPSQFVAPQGLTLDAAGTYMTQVAGTAFLAGGIMTWVARNEGPSVLRDAVLLGQFVGAGCGAVVALLGILNGTLVAGAWAAVGFAALISLSSGYCRFMAREVAPVQSSKRAVR